MKKSKLSIGLVTSFVAALAMSACSSDVTSSKDAIVSFKDYSGEDVSIITDKMYAEYSKSPAGISKFYDAIMETLIRYEFQNENSTINSGDKKTKKDLDQIKLDAKRKVEGLKADAHANADTNGTSYSKEWENILKGEGVEDEKELKEKYIYAGEKEEIEDWYYEQNKDLLTKQYLGIDDQGNAVESPVASSLPYHIRHILVGVSSGAKDFYDGTIDEPQALKLSSVAKLLADGKSTFGHIASSSLNNDDSGSLPEHGDLKIMDKKTPFVNEFKLGIYAYDALYTGKNNEAINDGLGLNGEYKDGTVKEAMNNFHLTYVPYDAFEAIGEYKDVTTSNGVNVNKGNANYYPRNIMWNKYLNHHNPFLISNNTLSVDKVSGEKELSQLGTEINAGLHAATGETCGFRKVPGITTGEQMILTDEGGRPIVGVRSEHGIHFMVLQKSIFDYQVGGSDKEAVSLEEYYTSLTPGEEGFPTYNGKDKETFVNFVNTQDEAILSNRAKDVKDAIMKFDSTYNYRLYEFLIDDTNVDFNTTNGLNLKEDINNYISLQRQFNTFNDEKALNEAWYSYIELLEAQESDRTAERLVPEMCAIRFQDAYNKDGKLIDDEFGEGGKCYYAN